MRGEDRHSGEVRVTGKDAETDAFKGEGTRVWTDGDRNGLRE